MKKLLIILALISLLALIGCKAKDQCPSSKKHYHNKPPAKMRLN